MYRLGFGVLLLATLVVTACNTGGGLVSANNPLNPTPAPTRVVTATPTPSPSPIGPTPTPTPTAAACAAPPPDPNTSTVTLTGLTQTITVPCFASFSSTAIVPPSDAAGMITVALAASTDKNLGGVPDATYGTPLIYASLQPSASITFASSSASIATTLTGSPIAAPHTYAIQVYVPSLGVALQSVTGLKPKGHSLTFNVSSLQGAFPNIEAVVIVYQSS